MGIADPCNMPGARGSAAIWADSGGNIWLLGGSGYGGRGDIWVVLNDFWRFDGTNWTWMGGSYNYFAQAGTYGTKGISDIDNMPGSRYGAVAWTDRADNLWLFGGWGYDAFGQFGWLSDLWKFDGEGWAWVAGSNMVNQAGVYGTRGQGSAENNPGARWGAVGWVDKQNNLWLFGGAGSPGMNLNDMWRFDGTAWTWVAGSNVVNQPGIYGRLGVTSGAAMPGARDHSVGWTDSSGNLWLFGGWSLAGYFNDLWKFDGASWTWMDGSSAPDEPGVYGAAGTGGFGMPGARWAGAAWTDEQNNLWLFGGWNNLGYYNDLWSFPIFQNFQNTSTARSGSEQ